MDMCETCVHAVSTSCIEFAFVCDLSMGLHEKCAIVVRILSMDLALLCDSSISLHDVV